MNKSNKYWNNQTKVELAYMLHYIGFSPQSHVPQQVLQMLMGSLSVGNPRMGKGNLHNRAQTISTSGIP